MHINLIKDGKLLTYKLPNVVSGNIWLTEIDSNGIEKNIVSIEANKDGRWEVVSNNDYFMLENNKKVPYVMLDEKDYIVINNNFSTDKVYLFKTSSYEKMNYYSCSKDVEFGISIGRIKGSTIYYDLPMINDTNASIKLENGEIILKDLNSPTGVYVNNDRVENEIKINFGDIIFIAGMKLLFLKVSGEYVIGISDPCNKVQTFMKPIDISEKNKEEIEEAEEDKEMELYSKEDYFYRKPRFIYNIDKKSIRVDTPPGKAEKNDMPAILTIGPMLTMSMTSVMTFYTAMNNVNTGVTTMQKAMPSLIMSGAMMLSFLLWPMLTNAYQKHSYKKREKERQKKYSAYIDTIKEQIAKEKLEQEDIMRKRFLSNSECAQILLNRQDRLWERRVKDDDFLNVSLGTGNLPLEIDVSYPEEHFSMTEDNLLDKVRELQNNKTMLENVPIPYSLRDNFITAIIGDKISQDKLIKNIILQLTTFHSYDDLKIAVFTSKEKKKKYSSIKSLPHLWSNDKSVRYFATKESEYKEITYQLDKIYNQRAEKDTTYEEANFYPYYVLIVDSINSVRNLDLFNNLINNKNYVGFSLIILNDRMSNLPDQCQTFIDVTKDISTISQNTSNSESQEFKIDFTDLNLSKCFKNVSNIPIEIRSDGEGIIPKKVGFLEMYNVSKVEQFNSRKRWEENVPVLNMAVPVGIGKNGEKISLDLHEKYHGPHGLIAGMTGSGKSEFIITYILSLAVNYHPDEVQFILIDYKGGGLAGAFENQNLGIKLPHVVGVITNLDKNEINRSLASIESELKRRQALFNKAREISEESTIDIYKYQEMYRNHVVDEPVSHLFIIADEFAELKNQQPEFMDQLISTARIGRSLGVHLILATQKPSGVVDAQIWSNTRFRVCLRVQEKGDSTEVIKQPDAAYLTQTGRFYLQVGFNEIFVLGQSAWAGGKYLPTDKIKKTVDTSIDFVNNIGYKIRSVQTKQEEKVEANYGEELINIVKYLSGIAKEDNIKTRPLWLSRIPECIYIIDLIKKYSYQKSKYVLNPIIGEYDVPTMQQQRILTIPFYQKGNALVYGIAGSGKENFITTLIFSSMVIYSPQEVNFYVIDFGSESLRYFDDSPYVGDIMYSRDSEKIDNLFKMIQSEINERKQLFASYNGNFIDYCENSGETIPNIVVVINNYEAYQESYSEYEDILNLLTRDCTKYGIYFVLTVNTPNGIRFKLKQNFGQSFVLQQNNEEDYSTILGNVRKTYPAKLFGRGLIKEDGIYEFQTALATDKDNIPNYIKAFSSQLKSKYNTRARRVPILPDIVTFDDCNDVKLGQYEIALGINKSDLRVSTYDFTKDVINIVTSQDMTLLDPIITPIIRQYMDNTSFNNIIINAENFELDETIKSGQNYFDNNFDSVYDAIKGYMEDSYNQYKNNNSNRSIFDGKPKFNCVIIGINLFKSKLSADRQKEFDKLFNNANELGIINFIIVDTVDKIKKNIYDAWFKDNYNQTNGIYIGNGLADQMTINISKRIPEMKEDVPYNFGFVIRKGIPTYVKFVEKYK